MPASVVAAVWMTEYALAFRVPLVSKSPTCMGHRKVAPFSRRPLKIPEVSHTTLQPTPAAQSALLDPEVAAPLARVQEPVSSPVVLSIESPVVGTAIVVVVWKYALIASKNVLRSVQAVVELGRA